MRVLFSNPPWYEVEPGTNQLRKGVRAGSRWPFTYGTDLLPDAFAFGGYLPYPFFMGYAASYVAVKAGVPVTLRDSVALHESYRSYGEYLQIAQPDLIFIESATPSWEHDSRIIREIAALLPRVKIAVCGPITTVKADEILALPNVVAAIKGEYEKAAVKVAQGATGVFEHDLLSAAEMNAAPFPMYDKDTAWRYYDANPQSPILPQAHVWSSRGCPYKCVFCVWPATMTGNDPDGEHKRTVRHYTPEYMEGFLRHIVGQYRFRSIYFDDDTFNLGNKHVERMCEVMRKIGLPWSAMCRADTIARETWKLMRDSGCYGVKLGFESGNQHVIDHIVNKGLDLAAARETTIYIRSLGMTVHGTFTYGLPGETKEQMAETQAYIRTLPLSSYQESGTAEIEGTPLHTLRSTGKLAKYDGATLDDNYSRNADGAKKFESIRRELALL